MNKKMLFFRQIHKYRILLLMSLPAVVYFFIFSYIPMYGITLAFKKFQYSKGILFSPWNGIENFKYFFLSNKAYIITRNTILYNLAFIVTGTIMQLVAAIIISELGSKYFKKIAQSAMFLPYFISWVLVGAFLYNIFNYEYGMVNGILKSLNIKPIDIYGTTWIWKYIFVVAQIWKGVGYGSIVYLSAIMGIDTEYYEAAKIDGASLLKQIRHITLPLLTPTIVILFLLGLGSILRGDFQMFYQFIGDAPGLFNSTEIIDTFVFRSLVRKGDIGMASASGFYQSVFCFITIISVNFLVKRYRRDYALF